MLQRQVLGALRNVTFTSLAELDVAIKVKGSDGSNVNATLFAADRVSVNSTSPLGCCPASHTENDCECPPSSKSWDVY